MTPPAGSQPRVFGAGALANDVSPARRRLASRLRERLAAASRHLPRARARTLPAELRTQLALQRGERVLSLRHDPEGDYALVASDRALYHRNGGHTWSRLGWERITRVRWDAEADRLLIFGLEGLAPERTVVPLRGRGRLLELAQERTTHTRLGRWNLRVGGDHTVLVEVRRLPGTGELVWAVLSASDTLDHIDAEAAKDIARAVARLGEHLGVSDPPSAGDQGSFGRY